MRTLLLMSLLATGCQNILGLEDTKLRPDARPIDAAPDAPPGPPIFIGDGADGPLTVTGTTYTDEVRVSLTAEVGANSTLIKVSSVDGFSIGDEILIMQMAGDNAGQYETHELAAIQPGQLLLSTQLRNSYPIGSTGATQVMRVPNHTDVTVLEGGVLTAHAWDGETGGVMMFRASGTLHIQAGGAVDADMLGFAGGTGAGGGIGGEGGAHGGGGSKTFCAIGCGGSDLWGGNGGWATVSSGDGAPGQQGNDVLNCHGGDGGRGGLTRPNGMPGLAGSPGSGLGASLQSDVAAVNASPNVAHPILGGGGAGGSGGGSGGGAGGGGGGGGSVTFDANHTGGTNGTAGGVGGDGGTGGDGGRGGGIIIVHATVIQLEGRITARGAAGAAGTAGTDGGTGGTGGLAGPYTSCLGSNAYGGRGGGGQGADGGAGGNGGAGGGGGVIELDAFTIMAGGDALASGGAGGDPGAFGLAGQGGDGFDHPDNLEDGAKSGRDGAVGVQGAPGAPGVVYLRYGDTCSSCSIGTPAAIVMKL
ncbi:MAG: hypothetical protein AB7L28_26665 [Kofleriaceae bacterium]